MNNPFFYTFSFYSLTFIYKYFHWFVEDVIGNLLGYLSFGSYLSFNRASHVIRICHPEILREQTFSD